MLSSAAYEPTIPASERPQTYALDRAATGWAGVLDTQHKLLWLLLFLYKNLMIFIFIDCPDLWACGKKDGMVSFRLDNEYIVVQSENWPIVLQCLSASSVTVASSNCRRILNFLFTSSSVSETYPEHRSKKSHRLIKLHAYCESSVITGHAVTKRFSIFIIPTADFRLLFCTKLLNIL